MAAGRIYAIVPDAIADNVVMNVERGNLTIYTQLCKHWTRCAGSRIKWTCLLNHDSIEAFRLAKNNLHLWLLHSSLPSIIIEGIKASGNF